MAFRTASAIARRRRGESETFSSEATSSAEQVTQGDSYWRANRDTRGYSAPAGVHVCDIEAGTVVKEVCAFVDIFDELWISVETGATEEEEAAGVQNVWIRKNAPSGLVEERQAQWDRVVEQAQGEASSGQQQQQVIEDEYKVGPVDVHDVSLKHSLSLIVPHFKIYCDWFGGGRNQTQQQQQRDWNQEYQYLIETLAFDSTANTDNTREAIHNLFSEFGEAVEAGVTTIVAEISLSQSQRTIPAYNPALAMGCYIHNGILFRICLDSAAGVYGGDANAMKVASQELKANGLIGAVAPKFCLHQPLAMVMTFQGYRIWASTLPPVTIENFFAGSLDGGKSHRPPTGVLTNLLEQTAKQLNLKEHQVAASSAPTRAASAGRRAADGSAGPGPAMTSVLPVDAAVFLGHDHRFYLLNVGRTLPPLAPLQSYHGYSAVTAGLFWRLRPEALLEVDNRVSSDAFFPGACDVRENTDVVAITQTLRDHAIPSVAAVLGFLEPTSAPTVSFKCKNCGADNNEHIAFNVCQNDEEDACCCICPQCLLQLNKMVHYEDKSEEVTQMIAGIVTCGHAPRPLHGFKMTPDISTILHSHGVNFRYLNYVHSKIPNSARACTVHHAEIEMIARAAKHVLNRSLRQTTNSAEIQKVCSDFWIALLQPHGEAAERFWAETLGPAIQRQFDVTTPFDTDSLDVRLVYERVSELTGIELSQESLNSILSNSEECFLQIRHPRVVMKQVRMPHLVEQSGEAASSLNQFLDELRMFWRAKQTSYQLNPQGFRVPSYLNLQGSESHEDMPW